MTTTDVKTCSICREAKACDQFGKRSQSADGLDYRCKQCRREAHLKNRDQALEKMRSYHAENRDRKLRKQREHYASNKDRINEGRRDRTPEDRERIAGYDRDYRERNHEAVLERQRRYAKSNPHVGWEARFRARNGTGVIEQFTHADVVSRYGDHCNYCTSGPFEELDHSQPVALGGDHALHNVRPTCIQCHNKKTRADISHIRQLKG